MLNLKRLVIWIDCDDKDQEELLHKVKVLLSVIKAKYTIVEIQAVGDADMEDSK